MSDKYNQEVKIRDFPGVPVVKNPPSNAGDAGSIPGWGTKSPHAIEQLSLCTPTESHVLRLRPDAAKIRNKEINFLKCLKK